MLKIFKNQLADFLSNCPIPIDDFEITFPDPQTTQIFHNTSSFVFIIHQSAGDFTEFQCRFTVFAPNFPLSIWFPDTSTTFDKIIEYLSLWIVGGLGSYLNELNTPDFLDLLINNNKTFSPNTIDFSSNAKFSKDEIKLLSLGLNEIKNLIQEKFDFNNEQIQIINQRISYIEEAAERLGKLDWKNILISTVLGIITALSLDTDKGKMIWDLFSKVLDSLPQLPH